MLSLCKLHVDYITYLDLLENTYTPRPPIILFSVALPEKNMNVGAQNVNFKNIKKINTYRLIKQMSSSLFQSFYWRKIFPMDSS